MHVPVGKRVEVGYMGGGAVCVGYGSGFRR
jgi:hypothetical protein